MSAYMKNKHTFLGVPSPARKSVFGQWYKTYKSIILDEWRATAKALYSLEYREYHYCAIDLLVKQKKKLTANDIALVEWMLVTHSWWDSVDAIASHLVGKLFTDVNVRESVTTRWMASGNVWLQRSCILSQLKYREETQLEYLIPLIDQTYQSKEFFIQKANGWALRQASKYYRDEVAKYVASKSDWPRVIEREAKKYL